MCHAVHAVLLDRHWCSVISMRCGDGGPVLLWTSGGAFLCV